MLKIGHKKVIKQPQFFNLPFIKQYVMAVVSIHDVHNYNNLSSFTPKTCPFNGITISALHSLQIFRMNKAKFFSNNWVEEENGIFLGDANS